LSWHCSFHGISLIRKGEREGERGSEGEREGERESERQFKEGKI
jgi:hypothetical protein